MRTGTVVGCLFVLLFSSEAVFGHGGLHEKINHVSRQIQQEPERADLYLQRAELHRLHQDWQRAHADLDRAAELDAGLDAVYFQRAGLLLDTGRGTEAVNLLTAFLQENPEHGQGLIARGRIHARLKQSDRALADYDKALSVLNQPEATHYVERARLVRGQTTASIEAALKGIEAGMDRLGPQLPLQLYAIELELARNAYERALSRLEAIAHDDPRQESWLALEGEILVQAGRMDEARRAFNEALAAIESLPLHLRQVHATRAVEQQVRDHLERLSE